MNWQQSPSEGVRRATGTIRYNPRLADRFDPWWVIVECEEALALPLREQVHEQQGIVLEPPLWGTHISVVTGEEPPLSENWLWRDGETVEFAFTNTVSNVGAFWWVDVDCPELLDLRERLGLPREPKYPLHLTLGREGKSKQPHA